MKFLLTMNQIAYFKPTTTARRLKNYYDGGKGDSVIFLGYLRLIRLLPELADRAKPFQPELYRQEVRQIFLDTPWEQSQNPWLPLFLREFREFFTASEWQKLKLRYQACHPFLGKQIKIRRKKAQVHILLAYLVHFATIAPKNRGIQLTKLRC